MAKRFFDTDKYGSKEGGWYRDLPIRLKAFWDFLNAQCDIAGIWSIDFKSVEFHLGEQFKHEDLDSLGNKVTFLPGGLVFIRPFILEQYGKITPGSKIDKGIRRRFAEHRLHMKTIDTLYKEYLEGIHTLQDQDQDQYKDQDQNQEGGVGETIAPATMSPPVDNSQSFSMPNVVTQTVSISPLNTALEYWQRTLDHFKAGREPLQSEKEQLFRMLQTIPLKELCHGISGMRFEPSTPSYDPSKHVDVFKLWDSKKRAKFVTLSTQEAKRRSEKAMAPPGSFAAGGSIIPPNASLEAS